MVGARGQAALRVFITGCIYLLLQDKRLSGGSSQSGDSQRSGSTVSAGYQEDQRPPQPVQEPEEEEETPADDMEVEYLEVSMAQWEELLSGVVLVLHMTSSPSISPALRTLCGGDFSAL